MNEIKYAKNLLDFIGVGEVENLRNDRSK